MSGHRFPFEQYLIKNNYSFLQSQTTQNQFKKINFQEFFSTINELIEMSDQESVEENKNFQQDIISSMINSQLYELAEFDNLFLNTLDNNIILERQFLDLFNKLKENFPQIYSQITLAQSPRSLPIFAQTKLARILATRASTIRQPQEILNNQPKTISQVTRLIKAKTDSILNGNEFKISDVLYLLLEFEMSIEHYQNQLLNPDFNVLDENSLEFKNLKELTDAFMIFKIVLNTNKLDILDRLINNSLRQNTRSIQHNAWTKQRNTNAIANLLRKTQHIISDGNSLACFVVEDYARKTNIQQRLFSQEALAQRPRRQFQRIGIGQSRSAGPVLTLSKANETIAKYSPLNILSNISGYCPGWEKYESFWSIEQENDILVAFPRGNDNIIDRARKLLNDENQRNNMIQIRTRDLQKEADIFLNLNSSSANREFLTSLYKYLAMLTVSKRECIIETEIKEQEVAQNAIKLLENISNLPTAEKILLQQNEKILIEELSSFLNEGDIRVFANTTWGTVKNTINKILTDIKTEQERLKN